MTTPFPSSRRGGGSLELADQIKKNVPDLGTEGAISMSNEEIFGTYVLSAIVSLVAAAAAFLGNQLKRLYEKYVNDKTKQSVVRTCVKAVEQLYHDLGGPEKLEKAKESAVEMLNEKGIPITDLELSMLIESAVSEFNYGFSQTIEVEE